VIGEGGGCFLQALQRVEDLMAATTAYLPGGGFEVLGSDTEQGQAVWALSQHNVGKGFKSGS
jgi:hypothetical protein